MRGSSRERLAAHPPGGDNFLGGDDFVDIIMDRFITAIGISA
jgi:hypothetical protein